MTERLSFSDEGRWDYLYQDETQATVGFVRWSVQRQVDWPEGFLDRDFVFVHQVRIFPVYRGRGHGKAMMKAFLSRTIATVILRPLPDGGTMSQKQLETFYRDLGFAYHKEKWMVFDPHKNRNERN